MNVLTNLIQFCIVFVEIKWHIWVSKRTRRWIRKKHLDSFLGGHKHRWQTYMEIWLFAFQIPFMVQMYLSWPRINLFLMEDKKSCGFIVLGLWIWADNKFQGSLFSRRPRDILFWIKVLYRQRDWSKWPCCPQTLVWAGRKVCLL